MPNRDQRARPGVQRPRGLASTELPSLALLMSGCIAKDQRGSYAGDPAVNPGIFVHREQEGKDSYCLFN